MRTQTIRRVLVVVTATLLTSAVAHAQTNVLYMNSQPGDYIGGGQVATYTDADGTFTATQEVDRAVWVRFNADYDPWWDLHFAAPGDATVVPGMYAGATRWPFQSPTHPGLDVGGDGRGCNTLTGRFVVLEASYSAGGDVLSFAADFEQHCEGGTPALYGAIRFNSSLPIVPVLSIGDGAVIEDPSGAPITFTISLSRPASAAVTVDWATLDGTALAGSHYTAAEGSVAFARGQTSQQVTVETLSNGVADGNRYFSVVLSNPSGASIAVGQAKGTIVDGDGPQTFLVYDSQPGDYIGLGQSQRLTTLDGTFAADFSGRAAHVGFTSDTWWDLYFAAAGDAVLTPGEYTNATRWPFQLPSEPGLSMSGDGRGCNELTGWFVVHEVSTDASGAILSFAASFEQHCEGQPPALYGAVRFNSTVPLVSMSEVAGRFEFLAPRYSASEAGGLATVAVRRVGGNGSPATVRYSTQDGTATAAAGAEQDYAARSGTLTFTGTQTLRTFQIPITKDMRDEANETVVLRLSGPQPVLMGASLGPQSTALLTIVDNDAGGTVQFSPAAFSVNAAAGASAARLTVRRTGGLASGVTVHCTMTDGAATGGVDYDNTAQDVTFTSVGTGASTQILTIPVSQNTSGTKTFTVTLSAPTGGATLGAMTTATVTILGAQPTLSFSSAAYSVKTTQAGALINVKRSAPSNGTVTAQYATSPGTAANGGGDYTDVSGTLTFGPTVFSRSFTVPITKDLLVDTPKTVNLTLASPAWSLGTAALDPALATATLTIVNPNLAPTVAFTATSYTGSEATLRALVNVKRAGDLVGTVTVEYAVTGGSATNGDPAVDPEADYRLNAGVLTFAPNVTTQSIVIPIVNDTRTEGTETALVTLSNPAWTGGTASVGPIPTAALNILDNETTVQFSQTTYAVGEAARAVTIVVKRTGSVAAAATVDYAVTGGRAIPDTGAGGDYVPLEPGTLSFLPGQLQKSFVITLQPDTWVDGLKTIELGLSSPTGAGLGTPSGTVVTIKDDDVAGKVQFAAAVLSVTEASGTATITVTRAGGAAGPATIDYATLDSDPGTTAVAGVDYTPTSGTLTFNWNEKSRTFAVPILDDGVAAGGAVSVLLALSAPGGGLALGAPSTAALWIVKE